MREKGATEFDKLCHRIFDANAKNYRARYYGVRCGRCGQQLEAHKSLHFALERRNSLVHEYHLTGINRFCGTNFGKEEIGLIYERLDNRCNHELTIRFIRSSYNMTVLTEEKTA